MAPVNCAQVMTLRGLTFHPVNAWPLAIDREIAFKDGFTQRLGWLPIPSDGMDK